jgi:predicted metalloendopeptidase
MTSHLNEMNLENEKHLFYLLSLDAPPFFPDEILTQKEEEYAKRLFNITKARYHNCLNYDYGFKNKWNPGIFEILNFFQSPLTEGKINLSEFANFIYNMGNNFGIGFSASVSGNAREPSVQAIQIKQSKLVLEHREDYRVTKVTNAYLKVMETIFKYHFGPVYVPFNVAEESFIKQYVLTDSANLEETKNNESGMTPAALDMKLRDAPNLNLTPTPSKSNWYSVAKGILEFESKLAALLESSPRKNITYARTFIFNIEKEYPGIGLDTFLSKVYHRFPTIPMENEIIVHNPTFFNKLGSILQSTRGEIINYYAWILLIQRHLQSFDSFTQSKWNSFEFAVEAFSTRSKSSIKKRICITSAFSDFVGNRWFTASKLPLSSKTKVTGMFAAIKREFEHRIPSYTWLDAATRRGMKQKVSKMLATIGYPKRYMSIMELAEYMGVLSLEEISNKKKFFQNRDSPMSPNAARENFKSQWEKETFNSNAYYNVYQNNMVRTVSCFTLLSLHSLLFY